MKSAINGSSSVKSTSKGNNKNDCGGKSAAEQNSDFYTNPETTADNPNPDVTKALSDKGWTDELFSRVCQYYIDKGIITVDTIKRIIQEANTLEEARTRVREEIQKNTITREVKLTSTGKEIKVPWYAEAAIEMLIEVGISVLIASFAQALLAIKGALSSFLAGSLTAVIVQLIEATMNGKDIDIVKVLLAALVAGLVNMFAEKAMTKLFDNIGPLFKKLCGKISSGIEKTVNSLGGNGTLIKSKIDNLAYTIDDVIAKVREKFGTNGNKFINNLDSVDANKISHIIDPKHYWEMVTDDVSWNSVKKVLKDIMNFGEKIEIGNNVFEFSKVINGKRVTARFKFEDDVYKIGTAFVKKLIYWYEKYIKEILYMKNILLNIKKSRFLKLIKENEFEKAYLLIKKNFGNLFTQFTDSETVDFSLLAFFKYLIINKKIKFNDALYVERYLFCMFWRLEIVGFQQYCIWDEIFMIDYYPDEIYTIEYLNSILNDGDPYISQYYSSDYFKYLEKKLNVYNNEEINNLFNNIKSRYEKCNKDCNKF